MFSLPSSCFSSERKPEGHQLGRMKPAFHNPGPSSSTVWKRPGQGLRDMLAGWHSSLSLVSFIQDRLLLKGQRAPLTPWLYDPSQVCLPLPRQPAGHSFGLQTGAIRPLRGHGREVKRSYSHLGGEDWECMGSAHQIPERRGCQGHGAASSLAAVLGAKQQIPFMAKAWQS